LDAGKELWKPRQSLILAGLALSPSCLAPCGTGQTMIDTGCNPVPCGTVEHVADRRPFKSVT